MSTCYWQLYWAQYTEALSHFCSPMKEGLSILCMSQPFQWLQIWEEGGRVAEPCCPSAGSWTWEMGHGWWTPFYDHPVFEGEITWPPVITVLFPQLYSLILDTGSSYTKALGSLHPCVPLPCPPECLIAGKKDISVLFFWTESHLAASLGPLATSIMTPHCSEILTVCICLFCMGRQCGPFTPLQSKADLRRSNRWLDFIALN